MPQAQYAYAPARAFLWRHPLSADELAATEGGGMLPRGCGLGARAAMLSGCVAVADTCLSARLRTHMPAMGCADSCGRSGGTNAGWQIMPEESPAGESQRSVEHDSAIQEVHEHVRALTAGLEDM